MSNDPLVDDAHHAILLASPYGQALSRVKTEKTQPDIAAETCVICQGVWEIQRIGKEQTHSKKRWEKSGYVGRRW